MEALNNFSFRVIEVESHCLVGENSFLTLTQGESDKTYDRSHNRRGNAEHQEELCSCPGAARRRPGIAPQ